MPETPYRSLARVPGAVGFFAASSIGRLGVAMSGVALLWTVRHYSGSFAVAGVVVGVFAIAEALVAPQVARAIDRYGQPRVLPLLVAAHVVGLALLVVGLAAGVALPALGATAALAGASIPQPGALSAVRWTQVVADRDLLRTAFSLEAVANDVAFVVGPALVVAVGALAEPLLGTAIAAAVVAGGCIGLARQRSSAPPARGRRAVRRGVPGPGRRLWSCPFVALLVVQVALGALFGTLQLSVAAAAVEHHAVALGGVVYSLMSVASLVGGLAYGSRPWAWAPHRVLLAAATYMVIGTVLLHATTGMRSLALVLALIGPAIAPLLVVSTILTQHAVPAGALTQALTWLGSASAGGIAAGAAVAGAAVQAHGVSGGFVVATVAALVMAVAALVAGHATTTTQPLRREGS